MIVAGDDRRSLAGRRVLITGGTSGIGLATAQRLTDAGARVILLARGEAGLSDAASKLAGAATVTADVRDAVELEGAVAHAAGLSGGLDAVIANAGATPDGRLPPELRGVYDADAVAAEVVRALHGVGSLERTVGGLFAPAILLDALVPNLILRPLGIAARLGWRARQDQPSSREDAFAQPTASARRGGGLSRRPSMLGLARSILPPWTRP